MARNDLTRLSRTLSHALRHEPRLYELELDEEGWTPVAAVLATLRRESSAWQGLTGQDLEEAIGASSKRRHEIADGRIRALYGHSVPGKLLRTAAMPPARLFHGTSPDALLKIRHAGLLPMARQYVHLSVNRGDAVAVGKRKSPTPIILSVKAQEAAQAGVPFYAGNDRVWLADLVPYPYVIVEDKEGG